MIRIRIIYKEDLVLHQMIRVRIIPILRNGSASKLTGPGGMLQYLSVLIYNISISGLYTEGIHGHVCMVQPIREQLS